MPILIPRVSDTTVARHSGDGGRSFEALLLATRDFGSGADCSRGASRGVSRSRDGRTVLCLGFAILLSQCIESDSHEGCLQQGRKSSAGSCWGGGRDRNYTGEQFSANSLADALSRGAYLAQQGAITARPPCPTQKTALSARAIESSEQIAWQVSQERARVFTFEGWANPAFSAGEWSAVFGVANECCCGRQLRHRTPCTFGCRRGRRRQASDSIHSPNTSAFCFDCCWRLFGVCPSFTPRQSLQTRFLPTQCNTRALSPAIAHTLTLPRIGSCACMHSL